MRLVRRLTFFPVLAAAVAAHVVFWYSPRAREATLDGSSPTGRLFLGSDLESRLWLAYPHQTLGAARVGVPDVQPTLAAAGRLAGVGALSLPSFGPFAVPPGRALAIASDRSGARLDVVVEVYPAVALLAKAAGAIADNPFLGGGEVRVRGRRHQVTWRGFAWSLSSDPASAATGPTGGGPDGAALAFVRLERSRPAVAAGTYRIAVEGRELVLRSELRPRVVLSELDATVAGLREGLVLFASRRRQEQGASVLLIPLPGKLPARGVSLPDAAVLWSGPEREWDLPGESIARLVGLDLRRADAAGRKVVALGRRGEDLAVNVAPRLAWLEGEAAPLWVLWLRPGLYREPVAALAAAAERLPLLSRSEAQTWRDLATLLAAFPPDVRLLFAVDPEGGLELRAGRFDTTFGRP
jgi:hypothetical protein